MENKTVNVRRVALELLQRCESGGSYSNIAIDSAIKKRAIEGADRAFLTALFYGVIEKKLTLDYIISKLSTITPSKIEKETQNILRLGIYQLSFMEKIPPHAAVNETVSLANKRSRGFVNAILRRYLREVDTIEFPSVDDDPARYLSVKYSVCEPLCQKLLDSYGVEECEKMLEAFEKTPPITLSVNTLKISADELLLRLSERFPDAKKTDRAENGIILGTAAVSELCELSDGLCTVQDEASQLCIEALGAKRGDTVIDACACPGSKSFGAAIRMENEGKTLAFDIHENKLSLVERGAERLGISIISTEAHDARDFIPSLEGIADRIICDVPCSGFGVIAKKPELRYKDPKESEKLPDIQLSILQNVSRYLKVGGALLYSTCTVLPEENEKNIKRFLESNKDFSLVPFEVGGIFAKSGMITLLPHKHNTDGFFIAKLTRK